MNEKTIIIGLIILSVLTLKLGIKSLIWNKKHIVSSWSTRERIQGRFTGAKINHYQRDDGTVTHLYIQMFAVMQGVFVLPLLIVTYLIK